MARANKHVDMATKFVNGEHEFHQHCGTWSEECVHGCGYIIFPVLRLGLGRNVVLMVAYLQPVTVTILMRN